VSETTKVRRRVPKLNVRELSAEFTDDDDCSAEVYLRAGAIFQDRRRSLQSWLWAIYLFIATRHCVSAKERERTLGAILQN